MRSLRVARFDSELPYYVVVLVLSVLGISAFLWAKGVYPDFVTSLRYAAFNTVSVATNTGYATADYAKWPVFAPLWLMNPLLDFSGLPRFSDFKTEFVTPAVDTLLAENRALIARLATSDVPPNWSDFVQPLEDTHERLSRA